MSLRWFFPLGAFLGLSIAVAGEELPSPPSKILPTPASVGYLHYPCCDSDCCHKIIPYRPQPGDILLYDMNSKFYQVVFRLAKTGTPIHTAMVIAREDGTPALLELTGPTVASAKVCIVDIEPRLTSYPGDVMVRRLREPLTPEQSHNLTQFANSQAGKGFAMRRILMFGTPFNPHKGVRRALFGRTYLDRDLWFCSEMVVAAGTAAQVFDPRIHQANATLPRDLAFDERMDLSDKYHPIVAWGIDPDVPVTPKSLPLVRKRF